MSGLGLSILEEGLAKGRTEGLAKGRSEGLAKGIVVLGMDLGLSVDEIIEKLQDKMDITLEEAKEYVRMFGEQGSMDN